MCSAIGGKSNKIARFRLDIRALWSVHGHMRSYQTKSSSDIAVQLEQLRSASIEPLRETWNTVFNAPAPKAFGPDLLRRAVAYRLQERAFGGLPRQTVKFLEKLIAQQAQGSKPHRQSARRMKPGAILQREWKGAVHAVTVLGDQFVYDGKSYSSLSEIARLITGTRWSGPRFFGLPARQGTRAPGGRQAASERHNQKSRMTLEQRLHAWHAIGCRSLVAPLLCEIIDRLCKLTMNNIPKKLRCAIYTRKSTEHGLELEFNSLHAQREACEAYIKSQASLGWTALPDQYDDGAYSGGNLERPALQQLLKDIEARRVDVVVVYKIDRLTRSLTDFARLVEIFDAKSISFVAVTQQFNTTTSMGRLTLNVLLSFAQFERELSSERVRDKVAASRRLGK
jgi:predicted site-specific integrase-resolvase